MKRAASGSFILTSGLLLLRFVEVEHPVDAKLVGEHPETSGPKRLLQWHRDLALFAQCSEEFLNLLRALTGGGNREIVGLLEGHAGHCVRRHQDRGSL